MTLKEQVERAFEHTLPDLIEGFEPREGQLAMALRIAEAIEQKNPFIVEAGTGTGKTFAYLVPALLSGRRVLVSTATKALQEQLTEKDLPRILPLAPAGFRVVQLKGRDNYVCLKRLALAENNGALPAHVMSQVARIRSWLAQGGSGDRSDCTLLSEDAPVWRHVCAQAEFCQSSGCDEACRHAQLREQAQAAELVVVNHHLLAADMALQQAGAPGILPEREIYIIDEAHHLPAVVQQFLGVQWGSAQLQQLLDDGLAAQAEEAADDGVLRRRLEAIASVRDELVSVLGGERRALAEVREEVVPRWEAFETALGDLTAHLERVSARGEWLAAVHQQARGLLDAASQWWQADDRQAVAWFEGGDSWFRAYLTPLDVSRSFSTWMKNQGDSWIMASATLQDNSGFEGFKRRLGLRDVEAVAFESPFDHARQGLIYHPHGLPEPNDPDYVRLCLRRVWPLLKASDGHALLLFSSYRAMHAAHELLRTHWGGTLLMQGELPKGELLQRFCTSHRPVLLGTASFWEGVDLPGDRLRLVMIDRIPFSAPNDPVLAAQEARLKEEGLNAFSLIQLPRATLTLRQGVGRLIRTTNDRGVLVLCDPRLTQRSYGAGILSTLPPFSFTRHQKEAVTFLLEMGDGNA